MALNHEGGAEVERPQTNLQTANQLTDREPRNPEASRLAKCGPYTSVQRYGRRIITEDRQKSLNPNPRHPEVVRGRRAHIPPGA